MRSFAVLRAGRVIGRYDTPEAALAAAVRRRDRDMIGGVSLEVVWCRSTVPKLWVAFVSPDGGVHKTAYWSDTGVSADV